MRTLAFAIVLFSCAPLSAQIKPSDLAESTAKKLSDSDLHALTDADLESLFKTHQKLDQVAKESAAAAMGASRSETERYFQQYKSTAEFKAKYNATYSELLEKSLEGQPLNSQQFFLLVSVEMDRKRSLKDFSVEKESFACVSQDAYAELHEALLTKDQDAGLKLFAALAAKGKIVEIKPGAKGYLLQKGDSVKGAAAVVRMRGKQHFGKVLYFFPSP